ncbi:MAG: RluA family pseudouridine synthase [Candidatus Omnitrophica bacterium]|nr:RluA family pseudouridine synthase [Candidatus Omnitrophota bacterium]
MAPEKRIIVPPEIHHVRIDFFLAKACAETFSRTKIKTLIEAGKIKLNDHPAKPHTPVQPGDQIAILYEEEPEAITQAESIPIDIVFEDEDLIVVNKPAGMVVHPGSGNPKGTLVNALLHHTKLLSQVGEHMRPGIVHRLDKDTSGLLVVAKNDLAHRALADQFKRHEIDRIYWAVVLGIVQHDEMRSEEPLGRSVTNRKKVAVRADHGKPSITNFKVLKRFQKTTLVEARPETGRTHQIRVHLRTLGYPVLGDSVYGYPSPLINRQALHAKALGFLHPKTKQKLSFASELPSDMQSLLEKLDCRSVPL